MSSVSSLTGAPTTPSARASPAPETFTIPQPDHFYSSDPTPLPPSPTSQGTAYLSPDDDPMASRGIPVFRPTMAEFVDFEQYMTRIECWGRRSGIVKVIPPKEWSDSVEDIKPQLAAVKIKSPIEQCMRGRGGLFRVENMEKRKVMSVREWAELCAKDEFKAPGVSQVGVHNKSSTPAPTRRKRKDKDKPKQEPVEPVVLGIASPPNSVSPEPDDTKEAKDAKARNRRVERADKDASFVESFDPDTDWLPFGTKSSDYTPEFCAKLERSFWRNCGLGRAAWYGADTMGSLFTNATTSWNVASLPSTLSRLLPSSQGLPGVNTPYLYFGMWRASFAWHVEDMDLFSINYIHFGAPKFWYAVPQGRAGALESTMRGYFPKDVSNCPQFLRHKSFLASPTLLAQSAVRPNHLVQQAGEFVITYPRGYHAGFNLGFNCAESVNFALDSWLDEGRKAAVCKCVDFSVRIDVDQLLEDRRIDALEKADPKAAASARAARDGVEIPEANFVDTLTILEQPSPTAASILPKPRSPRKRKPALPFEPEVSPKRPRMSSAPSAYPNQMPSVAGPSRLASYSHSHAHHGPSSLKVTLKLGPAPPQQQPTYGFPCCVCVDTNTHGLVRVHDLPAFWRELCPTARIHYLNEQNSSGVWMIHEQCASTLPETWVDTTSSGERVAFGVDGIVRARWTALKCSVCSRADAKSHGALIQCTKGKCSKAFHVSCARDGSRSGILYTILREVEKEVVLLAPAPYSAGGSAAAPDAQVLKIIKKIEFEALCPQHNPIVVAERRATKEDAMRAEILALPPFARVKIRVSSGQFEVTIVRVLEEKRSVEVLWDASEVREVKWANLILVPNSYGVAPQPQLASTPTMMNHPPPHQHLSGPGIAPTTNPHRSHGDLYPQQPYYDSWSRHV
uniref:Specific transcriptional repressor n=1 Tax=Mycena chlorophos TaxID=658473 RepID=A0ABQ0LNP5_MYCCL|nr:specific transcriptional repressor [Mycena chlorophos]